MLEREESRYKNIEKCVWGRGGREKRVMNCLVERSFVSGKG